MDFEICPYLYQFCLKCMFKVVQIYLKKKHVTNCVYLLFLFCYRGLWKTNFCCRGHEKVILSLGTMKQINEAQDLPKVIGVGGLDQEKVRLYKNCCTANNFCIKSHFMLL